MYRSLRPLILMLDSERAHHATIAALKLMPARAPAAFDPILASSVAGLAFASPLGLAAGFDKDGQVPDAMLALGFGFVEVGTLTPKPQAGNPRPRLFRLVEDAAAINRLGFNNGGQAKALERLRRRAGRSSSSSLRSGIVGVNIGANKDSAERIADYAAGVRAMAPVADYLTINISSPNTPGLRQLQDAGALAELLAAVRAERGNGPRPAGAARLRPASPPVFLKVAPDLIDDDAARIVRVAIDHGIDALIVANTTVARPPLRSRWAGEQGGLSGAPLKLFALAALRRFRRASGGAIPLIAAGGIASADDALARIKAGASLVQLYTALVYEGPGLARRIAADLAVRLSEQGFANVAEAVGNE